MKVITLSDSFEWEHVQGAVLWAAVKDNSENTDYYKKESPLHDPATRERMRDDLRARDQALVSALFLLGGYSVDESTGYRQYCNDVWKSTDGEDWLNIKERTYPRLNSIDTWFPRMNHATVIANHGGVNYMYIIGFI